MGRVLAQRTGGVYLLCMGGLGSILSSAVIQPKHLVERSPQPLPTNFLEVIFHNHLFYCLNSIPTDIMSTLLYTYHLSPTNY